MTLILHVLEWPDRTSKSMDPCALYEKALELMENGRAFSLAEVIWSSGSTPQKAGALALFESNGSVWGTLGGTGPDRG